MSNQVHGESISETEDRFFRSSRMLRGRSDLAIMVWLFILLTAVRFIAEQVEPLWFPLLFAYILLPLLLIPREKWSLVGLRKWSTSKPWIIGVILAIIIKAGTIA